MNNIITKNLSIIVPTLNEEGNIRLLTERIHRSLIQADINYEIIFVDDHSSDNTFKTAEELKENYPISIYLKNGEKGKSFSLLEGFKYAKYNVICMIDADLQYPPEAMPRMFELIYSNKVDVVIADRKYENGSLKRKVMTKTFRIGFGFILHNLNFDIQSGLKMFKKEVSDHIQLAPTQWTFDLEFLIKARKLKYRIGEVDILFQDRYAGNTKIHIVKDTLEIALSAVKLKFAKD